MVFTAKNDDLLFLKRKRKAVGDKLESEGTGD